MFSCHDVEVEFEGQPRIALFDAPYGLELSCTRTGGWQMWKHNLRDGTSAILAGEYCVIRLSIWIKGIQILDRTSLQS